jgi:hypothetical protein
VAIAHRKTRTHGETLTNEPATEEFDRDFPAIGGGVVGGSNVLSPAASFRFDLYRCCQNCPNQFHVGQPPGTGIADSLAITFSEFNYVKFN